MLTKSNLQNKWFILAFRSPKKARIGNYNGRNSRSWNSGSRNSRGQNGRGKIPQWQELQRQELKQKPRRNPAYLLFSRLTVHVPRHEGTANSGPAPSTSISN